MPGNNFLGDNVVVRPEGLKSPVDQKTPVAWTEPLASEVKAPQGFWHWLKNSGGNKVEKEQVGADAAVFAERKKMLSEYNEKLSAENVVTAQAQDAVPTASVAKASERVYKETERPWTLKTNLIKEEVTTFVNWEKNIVILISAFIFSALVIGGAYGYLSFKEYQTRIKEKALSAEIADLKEKIQQAKSRVEEADNFQKRLNYAAALLDKHVYWTEFFDFLEKNTLASTFYSGAFSGNTKSDFKFSVSAKSYRDIDTQLRVFREHEFVKEAKTSSASLSGNGEGQGGEVQYDLDLRLSPDVFKKK